MSLVVACGYQEKISAPKSDKIILTLASEDKSIEITDKKIMQQITDHINCFEYRQSAFKTDDSVAYIIEWFSESNESLKKLSLCESANGVIYNDKHY